MYALGRKNRPFSLEHLVVCICISIIFTLLVLLHLYPVLRVVEPFVVTDDELLQQPDVHLARLSELRVGSGQLLVRVRLIGLGLACLPLLVF